MEGGSLVVSCTPVRATSVDRAANHPLSSTVFPIAAIALKQSLLEFSVSTNFDYAELQSFKNQYERGYRLLVFVASPSETPAPSAATAVFAMHNRNISSSIQGDTLVGVIIPVLSLLSVFMLAKLPSYWLHASGAIGG
nr:hypothetical protein Iba_chr10aCG9820 [Ipomoea batatas]